MRNEHNAPNLATRTITYNSLLSWCDKILFVIEELDERDKTIKNKESIIDFKNGLIEQLKERVSELEQEKFKKNEGLYNAVMNGPDKTT